MGESPIRRHLRDFRERVLGNWLDIRKLWHDRKNAQFDPEGVIDGTVRVNNGPWPFAIQALLLPATIVSAVVGTTAALLNLPETSLDRSIAEQRRLEDVLNDPKFLSHFKRKQPAPPHLAQLTDDQLRAKQEALLASLQRVAAIRPRTPEVETQLAEAFHAFNEASQEGLARSGEQLRASMIAAREEASNNRRFLLAIRRFAEFTSHWQFAIIGFGLLLNAGFFRWLIGRRSEFRRPEVADTAHLYLLGSALLLPNFVGGVASTAMEYADRYDIDAAYDLYQLLIASVGVWALFRLRSIVPTLTAALHPSDHQPERTRRIVANRLILSNLLSAVVAQVAVAIIGVPIFVWLLKQEGL